MNKGEFKQTLLTSDRLTSHCYALSKSTFIDSSLSVLFLKLLKTILTHLYFIAAVNSPIQKVHIFKPICKHYSNTGLKIAALLLPHSYLCTPSITLSHFKSDRGSLDRRSLTLTQALQKTGNRVNGRSLYQQWKAIMLCLSHELKVFPRWAKRPHERGNMGVILSRREGSSG